MFYEKIKGSKWYFKIKLDEAENKRNSKKKAPKQAEPTRLSLNIEGWKTAKGFIEQAIR